MIELTPEEQIQKSFDACMDSVNLINSGKPEMMDDSEWADCLKRNKDHLILMLAKNIFEGFDVTPLEEASQ
jgi:hypothetical protein